MRRLDMRLAGLVGFCLVTLSGAILLLGPLTSQAVQAPTISVDMVTAGTSYDETTNTMSVGTIENCLTTAPPGNNALHIHNLHVLVQNVEDLIGWQVRVNYLGDQFRPNTVNFAPFADSNTGQNISFVNLPIDQATTVHRDIVSSASIPASLPGPQTAAFGSVYIGTQGFAISPDTPAKAVPDDASYSAPSGGVLASFTAQVLAGNAGNPSLFLDLDDENPNGPGSGVAIFNGTTSQDIRLPETALGDGFHAEGAATCEPPANDNFAGATAIGALPFTDTQSTLGATNEPGEPSPCAGIGNAVWYTFTPSLDGVLEANTFGSNFDTALAVYRGTSLDNLTFVDCDDNAVGLQSRARFLSHVGETIYIQAGGFFGSQGNLTFNLLEFNPPANDDFPGSVIESLPFTATQNTATATFESGEPSPCAPMGATVWFSFTPGEDMSIAADTFGSDFDTVLAAYTGTSLFTLIPVACNDQFGVSQSKITFSATGGTTYYFQAGGLLGQTGNLVFSADVGPPPLEIAVSITPTGSVIPRDGTATVDGAVTCSKPAFVQLSGELSQQAGRATINGFFFTSLPCQGETFWQAEVEGENGPFAGGRAQVSVAAFAFAEGEADFAEATRTVVLKGAPPPPTGCPNTGNDGFEAGVVDTNVIPCWTIVDQEGGFGSWCNQSGTVPPQGDCAGSFAPVAAPPEGLQAAMTNQGGPGSHVLYRCGVLRSGQISFQLQINNQAFGFFTPPSLDFNVFPNQQFRADLVSAAGITADVFTVAPADVLLNLYQTQPGDPAVSGYGVVTADASAYVGQEVCLRFAEVDNQLFFNVGLDDVGIDLRQRR